MTKTERQKEWEDRIAEYQASGQNARTWCADHNVKPHQLWYWLRRQKSRQNVPGVESTQWLQMEVSEQIPMDPGNALLIRVGKASIEVKHGFNPALLSEIVRTLAGSC